MHNHQGDIMTNILNTFDQFLSSGGPAALVLQQPLQSVEGKDAIIFPPTYAPPKDRGNDGPAYNIDCSNPNAPKACVIDSIGAQANRIEPLFKTDRLKHLVPQITIVHKGGKINLLDAGHRAADAIVRFSELLPEVHNAFIEHRNGNPEPMARLAPTTLIFGAWDSRGTQHKIPRLVNMRIDAHDVELRTRSAQYVPAVDYVGLGLIEEVDESTGADLGFAAVPAQGQLGGVVVRGQVMRTGALNLTTLKALGANCQPTDLQRYILGLALVAMTELDAASLSLRQGCQLVGIPDEPAKMETVSVAGQRSAFALNSEDALAYATAAARKFGVGPDREAAFNSSLANKMRAAWSDDKMQAVLKDLAKRRPLTLDDIAAYEKQGKNKKASKAQQ
ncbi:MAG: type I-U CRISPR-associated protein Cas7 [Planctomycetes bacterium]|nr:type I-U CRISPR-associated protein Cas7 [Planctomycetota bacterium]